MNFRKGNHGYYQPTMNHKITVLCMHMGFRTWMDHIWELIYMEPSALNQD